METKKNTTKERMKEVLMVIGMTAQDFEIRCGLAHGFVQRITRVITKKTRAKIKAEFPNINIDYVAFGSGEMFITENETPETMKDRIRQFMETMDIKKKEFTQKTGISESFISNMSDNIRESSLERILRAYPKLNPEWLEYGKGEMLREESEIPVSDTIQDRIDELIGFLGITTIAFKSQTGIKHNIGNITKKTADKIVRRYPFVNPLWLMHGTGEMIAQNRDSTPSAPLISQRTYSGYLAGYGDENYLNSLKRIPYPAGKDTEGNIIAVEVAGDSMEDVYKDGDIVIAREIYPTENATLPYHKYDFVIVHKEGILIKRVIKHDTRRGTLTIHSMNGRYGDAEISMSEVLKVFIIITRISFMCRK